MKKEKKGGGLGPVSLRTKADSVISRLGTCGGPVLVSEGEASGAGSQSFPGKDALQSTAGLGLLEAAPASAGGAMLFSEV